MNARSHALDLRDVSNSMMRRLFAGLFLAFLLLNATIALAGAEKISFKYKGSQNQWVSDCRFFGATPHREASRVVSCTTGSGQKTTCDFNQQPANCEVTPPPKKQAAASAGDVLDQEIQAEDTGVVNPADASDTEVIFEEVSTGQADPSSAPDVILEDAVESELPVIEGDDSMVPEVPTDVEELPLFGQ